ncbi:DUF7275 domain-containing protein [Acinetobacter baumannii]
MIPVVIGSMALKWQLDKLGIPHNLKPNDVDLILEDDFDLSKIKIELNENGSKIEPMMTLKSKKFKTRTIVIKVDGVPWELTIPRDGAYGACTTSDILCFSMYWNDYMEINGIKCKVPPLDFLYTLKFSHRFLKNSPHFLKTMRTIKNLQSPAVGCKCYNEDWLKRRMQETYDYNHPNLKVNKEEFFNSNFNYIYDHDSIHEAVKLLDRPAYTYYMSKDAEVFSSREAFFAVDNTIRLLGVLEETYVLALERSQIPNDFNIDPKLSFTIALEKVCTSITSGWFRQYAWENYDLVYKMYDSAYVDKFKHALNKGIIKPYSPA